MAVVTAAARMSETGSARNTAKALSAKKFGRMKIRGISRISFRRQAIIRLIFACPRAINACWQLIWKPTENAPARKIRIAQAVYSTRAALLVKIPANTPGNSSRSSQNTVVYATQTQNWQPKASFTRSNFFAP